MARKRSKNPPQKLPVDHPLTSGEESILSGELAAEIAPLQTSAPAQKQSDRRYLEIDCPNCRAAVGQPCKWSDGSTCTARAKVWRIRNPQAEGQ